MKKKKKKRLFAKDLNGSIYFKSKIDIESEHEQKNHSQVKNGFFDLH